MVPSGEKEVGKGNTGVGDEEVQTIRFQINCRDILYLTGNTANVL